MSTPRTFVFPCNGDDDAHAEDECSGWFLPSLRSQEGEEAVKSPVAVLIHGGPQGVWHESGIVRMIVNRDTLVNTLWRICLFTIFSL